jgi:hypothetical protein
MLRPAVRMSRPVGRPKDQSPFSGSRTQPQRPCALIPLGASAACRKLLTTLPPLSWVILALTEQVFYFVSLIPKSRMNGSIVMREKLSYISYLCSLRRKFLGLIPAR